MQGQKQKQRADPYEMTNKKGESKYGEMIIKVVPADGEMCAGFERLVFSLGIQRVPTARLWLQYTANPGLCPGLE